MPGNHKMRAKMEKMLRDAQISITKAIQEIDGGTTFREDSWVRDTGGGGHSRVLARLVVVVIHVFLLVARFGKKLE
jgi:coproporphyrinogen III oxidase